MTDHSQSSPLRDLVRHTFVYGSGYVTMAIASLVLVPVYTRHLSPSQYGLLGLMLVLYGLMSQVYDFGVTNGVGRFYFDNVADGAKGLQQMRTTALTISAVLGGGFTLALWLFAGTWSQLLTQSAAHANLVRIVAVTLYAEALAIVPLTLIRMQERSRLFVIITLARFVVTLGLSVILVVVLNWGVRGALLANAGSAICVLIVLAPDYRHLAHSGPSWPLVRQMMTFGLPFFPVILSAWFIEASDRYLLGVFRSHTEVGWYVLGYKVAQVMQIALAAFSMGWAPLRYKIYERDDAPQVYRHLTSYYALGASMLTVWLGLFAREIVHLISPPSYSPASRIVPLIAFGYALNGLYILVVTGMGVAKKTAAMAWIVTVAAAVNVGINIVLIPRWGMMAAAVTTVLANVIMVAGGWWASERVYPIPYDWSRMARITTIGAVVVAAGVYLIPGYGLAALIGNSAAWLAFVVLLVWTGTISKGDLVGMRRLVQQAWHRLRRRSPTEGVIG